MSVTEQMGISDERTKQLLEYVKETVIKAETKTEVFDAILDVEDINTVGVSDIEPTVLYFMFGFGAGTGNPIFQ